MKPANHTICLLDGPTLFFDEGRDFEALYAFDGRTHGRLTDFEAFLDVMGADS